MLDSLLQSSSEFTAMHGGEESMGMSAGNSTLSGSMSYNNPVLLAHGAVFTILFLGVMPASILAAMGKRTKLHVGFQAANLVLFFIALVLGYAHESHDDGQIIVKNRSIKPHVYFGTFIVFVFFLQYIAGAVKYAMRHFPSLRSLWRFSTPLTKFHKWMGYSVWIFGLVQLMIGYATYYGSCADGHDINCIGHWLPGFAIGFFGFFILGVYIFHVNLSKPLEYYGSWVFITVGLPMLIFEHQWGQPWDGSDIFHVFLGGVLNVLGGLLGVATEAPYIKNRFLTYRNIGKTDAEKATNATRNENLNFIPALMVFINGLALLFHDQNPPFNATMHACMGVALILLSPILLLMTMNDAVVLRLLAAFLLVLEGVFFFGVSYQIQLAAEKLFEGMFIEYAVILIGLTLMLFAYVGGLMVAVQYCRASREHRDYDEVQNEELPLSNADMVAPKDAAPTDAMNNDTLPMALKRHTSGDEAHWMADERSMNEGDMSVEIRVMKNLQQV